MPPSRTNSVRSRLLDAAATCFYADGITASGIDTITAEAGVARKSLYNNFASKADLVEAYLLARHEEWLSLHAARRSTATTPREQVLAVFDAYADHANKAYRNGFRGCGLLNAAAELPAGSAGRQAVRRHKEEVEQLLADALSELCTADAARATAEHLSYLLEGAMARAGLDGDSERLNQARAIADALVAAL